MRKYLSVLLIVLLVINLVACGDVETNTDNGRIYKCDYKSLNLNTKITTTYNGNEITISGNILKILTDPLTVKDSTGNVIGYAGDVFGFISQDDHGIYVDNTFEINMCGNVDLWGESYKLKDGNGNVVGTVEFNVTNTSGSIVDTSGNLIATYSSPLMANDYTVTIYDNNVCSDLAILMIMSSYVSDFKADARSRN